MRGPDWANLAKVSLTAHLEADMSAAETMPTAASRARATGEKDFMMLNWDLF